MYLNLIELGNETKIITESITNSKGSTWQMCTIWILKIWLDFWNSTSAFQLQILSFFFVSTFSIILSLVLQSPPSKLHSKVSKLKLNSLQLLSPTINIINFEVLEPSLLWAYLKIQGQRRLTGFFLTDSEIQKYAIRFFWRWF